MHLDVARHFFDKEFVKQYIDYIATYKINVFHLYLTDDQGWRIKIKNFPRLTEVGAWRNGTGKHYFDGRGDQQRHGGYYTRDDIREIVAYAQQRFITVVPGISMPGHSQAALAAYPELSSTGGPFEVWTQWGISKEVMDPGKEEVFRFVEGVLSEATELFPGRYIHCGGDEVPRDRWRESSYAQARMRAEGLKTEDELQSYFTKRVERLLNSKGRLLVGWDEIIAGGLAPNAVVMSWRGTAGGVTAARAGHDVVMVPNRETYFNYMQHTQRKGPGHTGYLPLMKVYHFEPTRGMSGDEAKHVLGSQACLWTEYIPTPADVEYLLFPRLFAMSEVVWSPASRREDEDFLRRVPVGLARLKQAGVNHYDGTEYGPK
jgi:hexosaminidase